MLISEDFSGSSHKNLLRSEKQPHDMNSTQQQKVKEQASVS
jgi:hypothetical protein